MPLVGHARVSTRGKCQVFDRQMEALRATVCERILDDRGSGARTSKGFGLTRHGARRATSRDRMP